MRHLRGFLPWIVYPIAAAMADWRIAALIALAIAAVGAATNGARRDMFATSAVAFFGALFVVAAVDPSSGLHRFVGALTPGALAIAALVSIAIDQPFTIPFAKRVAPPEFWDTPMFVHINVVLSAVWAASFVAMALIIAAVVAFAHQAGVIIVAAQIAGFVIPMRICRSYPASVQARALID
ncbi:MAG TPA: hypothetical protein VFR41_05600 [Acidimicrobiia bacterium]|nr:hypothetical protein [Acidimicrobiia bacterium]